MVQYEIKVTGRVQGVGFRHYTRLKANEFDIKGWVRNTVDGGVKIVAKGEETDMETFIDFLRIGPVLSRVDKITKVKIEYPGEFDNFSVKF